MFSKPTVLRWGREIGCIRNMWLATTGRAARARKDPVRGNQILLVSKKPQHPECLISMAKFSPVG